MPQGGLAIYHVDEKAGYDVQGFPAQYKYVVRVVHICSEGNARMFSGLDKYVLRVI